MTYSTFCRAIEFRAVHPHSCRLRILVKRFVHGDHYEHELDIKIWGKPEKLPIIHPTYIKNVGWLSKLTLSQTLI